MIGLLSLTGIVNGFRKSLLGQIAVGIIALLGIWKFNNHFVAKKAVKGLVQASKKEGKKRNAQVRKIRRRIKPDSAMQRLRREYAESGKR